MTGWKEHRINELGTLLDSRRIPVSSLERAKRKGQYPYYGASGIVDYIDDFIFEGEHVLISEDGENLLSRNTPIAFIVSGRFWVNNHAHVFKGTNSYINRIVAYYLQSSDLNEYITGAAQPKLSQGSLLAIPFFLPTEPNEQKAIAAVLSSLDDKIDQLHRQNATLEAMAEALFRQWFVVEAKEGWEETEVGRLLEIKGGSTPKTEVAEYWNGDINWTSPRDLTGSKSVFMFETERKITEKGLAQISSGLLPPGTLLFSSRAPIGYLAITRIGVAINQGYIAILPNSTVGNYYMYLWCKHNLEEIKAAGNGSVFQEISKSVFRTLPFALPPKALLDLFTQTVRPLFEKIHLNQIQIRTLEKLRDTLLPKLMSGEIRVDH